MAESYIGRNPHDPITTAAKPRGARELLRLLGEQCSGFSHDDVADAALNLLVNALRQQNGRRNQAERSYDDLVGRTKQRLLDHYDSVSGRRRSVFAHDQVVELLPARLLD